MIERQRRRWAAAAWVVLSGCVLSGCAAKLGGIHPQRPMKEIRVQASAFQEVSPPPAVYLSWKKQPTLAELEGLLPADRPGHINFELQCQLIESGRLKSCELLGSHPTGPKYEQIAQKISRLFVARTDNLRGGVSSVQFVIFDFQLSDGSWGGPCWPPFCVSEPPPPRIKTCPDGTYVLAREPCPPVRNPSKT